MPRKRINPWPRSHSARIGLRVRFLKDHISGDIKVPAGTEGTITMWWGGATVRGKTCEECGLTAYATKVPEEILEILPGQEV